MYKRVLLKISGEILRNQQTGEVIDDNVLLFICKEIKQVHDLGVDIGLVVGGGNIFRGQSGAMKGIERSTGDFMGMLSTMINSMAIADCFSKLGVDCRIQNSLPLKEVGEPFTRWKTLHHFERKRVVIFSGGTGNPYFSTDTAAALRANEIGADIILKATKVDGIYDKDPKKFPESTKYHRIGYLDALNQHLNVMDSTAFSLCMDNHTKILVFDLHTPGNIKRAVCREPIGTLVC